MAASDHLSGAQFMSVRELGAYRSSDYPDKTMDQVTRMFGRQRLQSDRAMYGHAKLKSSIRNEGFHEDEPVEVDPVNKIYGQGHHRYVAARSLRMKEIPVRYRNMED